MNKMILTLVLVFFLFYRGFSQRYKNICFGYDFKEYLHHGKNENDAEVHKIKRNYYSLCFADEFKGNNVKVYINDKNYGNYKLFTDPSTSLTEICIDFKVRRKNAIVRIILDDRDEIVFVYDKKYKMAIIYRVVYEDNEYEDVIYWKINYFNYNVYVE